jgi:hypothetical protein
MSKVKRTVSLDPEVDAFIRRRKADNIRTSQGPGTESYSYALNEIVKDYRWYGDEPEQP